MARVERLHVIRIPQTTITAQIVERIGLGHLMPDASRPQKPEVVAEIDRPKRPWYQLRRWRATNADSQVLKDVMVPHLDGTHLGHDTLLHRGDFVVVREIHKGRKVKTKELRKWERKVGRRINKDKRLGRQEIKGLIDSTAPQTLIKEQNRYQEHVRLNKVEAVHRLLRGLSELGPLRFAKRILKPGQSQRVLEKQLKDTFKRLEDGIADPFNVIHGVAETVVQLQRDLESRPFGDLLQKGIFALSPRLNDFFNKDLSNLNKWTSRDTFASKVKVAIWTEIYTRIIDHPFFNPRPESKSKSIRLLGKVALQKILFSPNALDEAYDRQTERRDLVTLSALSRIVSSYSPSTPLMQKHQFDIAQATVNVLGQSRDLTDIAALKLGKTLTSFDRKTRDAIGSVMDRIPSGIKGFVKRFVDVEKLLLKPEFSNTSARKVAEDLVYSSKSMIEYYRNLFISADAMAATPGLTPIEIQRIKDAKEAAHKIVETYESARKITTPQSTQRRMSGRS